MKRLLVNESYRKMSPAVPRNLPVYTFLRSKPDSIPEWNSLTLVTQVGSLTSVPTRRIPPCARVSTARLG